MGMTGSKVFPEIDVLQKREVDYVLLQRTTGRGLLSGLFALKEVKPDYVLLQQFDPKAVAVLVKSFLLFDRRGCVLPLSPVLQGPQATPLRLVLQMDTASRINEWKCFFTNVLSHKSCLITFLVSLWQVDRMERTTVKMPLVVCMDEST